MTTTAPAGVPVPMGQGLNNGRKTPLYVWQALNERRPFTVDLAAEHDNALSPVYATEEGCYAPKDAACTCGLDPLATWQQHAKRCHRSGIVQVLEGGLERTCIDFRDALAVPWHDLFWGADGTRGCGFMNPPYGRPERACTPLCAKKKCAKRGGHLLHDFPGMAPWIVKAHEEAEQYGFMTVALLPVRTEQDWFHLHVMDAGAKVEYLDGRLKFDDLETGASFPSMIVTWR